MLLINHLSLVMVEMTFFVFDICVMIWLWIKPSVQTLHHFSKCAHDTR